jgi:cephalosporin hydroxylase
MPTLLGLYSRIRKALGMRQFEGIERFELDPSRREEFLAKARTDLSKLFFAHRGRLIHKPIHYLDAYDAHFGKWRGTAIRFLEIGVFMGGSLELWRNYFGPKATIFGIDIDPNCSGRVDAPNQVRIGSQDDPGFLERVIDEMGRPDIILDDGSHFARHQVASFKILFPLLADGGLYVIEDVCTAYWPTHGGGYRKPSSAIGLAKQIIDDMHAAYHFQPAKTEADTKIPAIHIYNSTIIIEKGHNGPLQQMKVGGAAA